MRKKNNKLDIIVGTVYDEMLINTPDTEEFKAQLDNLERLTTLKNKKEKVPK
jgi:NAD(P)H-flavin reductase